MDEPAGPPFDLHVITATLRGGGATDAWVASWLPAAAAAPGRFAEALHAYALTRRRGMKSRRGRAYDLYNDLVVANLDQKNPALFARDGGAFAEISYATLHDRATLLAAAWKRLGCERGQSIAVVLPAGVEYATAILAAIRMGLVITAIEPHGPSFVRRAMEAVEPDYTVSSERIASAVRLPVKELLPVAGTRDTGAPPACSYAPDDVVFALISPFADGEDPVEITAAALHAALIRDGLVVLGLETSDVLAAPGFDPSVAQPHLMLAAFAAGACFAAVGVPDLDAEPRLAERARLSVVGVDRVLRERLFARAGDGFPATLRAWFKNLSDVLDVDRWEAFGRLLADRKVPGFNVFVSAATGGVELFSPRGSPPACLRAWPAPGRAFQLSEVAAGALSALNETGVYTPMDGEDPLDLPLPHLLLLRRDEGYLFAGAINLGPDAKAYPRAEIARVAEQIPAVRHAAVVVGPGHWMNDARTVLVVFTDDARDPDGRIALPVTVPEIRARVLREMGDRFTPDRIAIYPLRPRLAGDAVDEGWCRSQYLGGALDAKARSEMFVLLSRLGYILAGVAPGE